MKAIANQVALYAAMKPIQGAEFDLDEKSIDEVCAEGSAVEGRTEETRTGIVKIPPQVLGVENDSEAASVDFTEIKEHLEHDHVDSASSSTNLVHRYPISCLPIWPIEEKISCLCLHFSVQNGMGRGRRKGSITHDTTAKRPRGFH
jgi:hypothetical protein